MAMCIVGVIKPAQERCKQHEYMSGVSAFMYYTLFMCMLD